MRAPQPPNDATILCRYGADPFKLDGLCRFNAIEFAENEGLVSLANYLKKADELSRVKNVHQNSSR